MSQLDLFVEPLAAAHDPIARRRDPWTSHVAAGQAVALAGRHRRMILAALEEGGATKDELAERTGLGDVAVARRMRRMANEGLVRESGTKAGSTGRPCTVWALVRGGNA